MKPPDRVVLMEHLNYEVCPPLRIVPWSYGGDVLPCYTIGEVCPPCIIFNPHGLFATLGMYSAWTEKEYSQMCSNMSL